MRRLFLTLALAAGLAACASGPGSGSTTPAQTVFAAKSAYASALTAAVAYRQLPACATPARPPCSDPAIVAQLQRADNVAAGALDAAEAAVRTPAVGATARDRAITTANSALAALSALDRKSVV